MKDAKGDTQPYQMLSTDEGKTWGEPKRTSLRGGYYVVNNSRVIRTSKGRMLVPAAYVERIDKDYDGQSVLVLQSDDDGVTWRESNVLESDNALMEPGVAECADGSIYMTIRTAVGLLYEARSRDGGEVMPKEHPLGRGDVVVAVRVCVRGRHAPVERPSPATCGCSGATTLGPTGSSVRRRCSPHRRITAERGRRRALSNTIRSTVTATSASRA